MSFSAGPIYRINSWLALRAGVGYQSHDIIWEDINGDWARVEGLNKRGLCLEAGAMLTERSFFLSAGLTVMKGDLFSPYAGTGLFF